MTCDYMTKYLRDQAVKVRQIVAEALKDSVHAPPAVIRKLARDIEIQVGRTGALTPVAMPKAHCLMRTGFAPIRRSAGAVFAKVPSISSPQEASRAAAVPRVRRGAACGAHRRSRPS